MADDPTIPGIDPTAKPSGEGLRRLRCGGGAGLVAASAALRRVRADRLLRLLAVPARHAARP